MTKMNKIYGLIAIFAFAGLLLPTSAMQVEAASDLDYMLNIAEKAKRYIKHNIDEMENSNTQDWKNRQAVLEIYNKSTYEMSNLDLIKAVTAETMFEYQWPPLMKHAEYYFLQEQVSEYLDIKAIKRKYPDLARRKVKTDERDFLLEMRVVNETQVRFHNIITVQSQFSDTFGLSEKCH